MLDSRRPLRHAVGGALAAMVALLIVLITPLPLHTTLMRAAADLVHAPLFAALGIVIAISGRRLAGRRGPLLALSAWLLTIVFGFLSEWAQHLTGRHPSWEDFKANVLGAAAGIVWLGILRAPPPRWRFAEQAGASLLFAVALWPSSVEFAGRARQWAAMPQLASFERSQELSWWSFQESRAKCDDSRATHGRSSMRLSLDVSVYPGAAWEWGPPDWSRYRELVFDACTAESAPLELVVKIADYEHNQQTDDRFHRTIRLDTSWQRVRIDLADVAAAPRTRTLDLRRIAMLQFFAIRPERRRTVYLDNIHLE